MTYKAVTDNSSFDACVVGNGSLGLSLGLSLSRRGLKVAVVGRSQRPWCASTAAGAMNGCFGEITTDLLSSHYGRTKLEMDIEATKMWGDWAAQLCEDSDVELAHLRPETGTVLMLNTIGTPEIDTDNYNAIEQSLIDYNEPYEEIETSNIDWLKPDPIYRPLKALYIPGEHSVNTPMLLKCLEASFVKAGGVLIDDMVEMLNKKSDHDIDSVTLSNGCKVSASVVVLAAGVQSHVLLESAAPEVSNLMPPMVSGYGVSVMLDTKYNHIPDYVIRTPNRAFACGLHCVPRSDGSLYLGATNIISELPQENTTISDLNFLMECGVRQLSIDLAKAKITAVQVGNRPIPLDGFPLIGSAGLDGVWMMTGTYRDGLHQSPLLAEELSNRILGDGCRDELSHFEPIRSPIVSGTRKDLIKSTINHRIATGYESDWRLPVEWPAMMEEHLHRVYKANADSAHPEFTPPPEIIEAMTPRIRQKLTTYYASYQQTLQDRSMDEVLAGYQSLLSSAITQFEEAQLCDSVKEARELLCFVIEKAKKQDKDDAWINDCFLELVAKRVSRIPLSYLTETAELGGLKFRVGKGVFVPRVQSEPFLQWALRSIELKANPKVVDLCAGSGALALALGHARQDANVTAVELSDSAMLYATENARQRVNSGDKPINLIQGDVCDPLLLREEQGTFDLVMSNPPYVVDGESLRPELESHQPREALYGGEDGLDVIRHVIQLSKRLLKGGGQIAMEHDDPQAMMVADLLTQNKEFFNVKLHYDQYNRPRWTTAERTFKDVSSSKVAETVTQECELSL